MISELKKKTITVYLNLFFLPCFLLLPKVSECNGEFFFKSYELFESAVYLEEAADVLCILQAGTLRTDCQDVAQYRYSVSGRVTV